MRGWLLQWGPSIFLMVTVMASCHRGADLGTVELGDSAAVECMQTQTSTIAEWVLGCLKNTNPKADEEPEDWMQICHAMGVNIHCPRVMTFKYEKVDGPH